MANQFLDIEGLTALVTGIKSLIAAAKSEDSTAWGAAVDALKTRISTLEGSYSERNISKVYLTEDDWNSLTSNETDFSSLRANCEYCIVEETSGSGESGEETGGGSVADGILTVSGTVSEGVLTVDGSVSDGVLIIADSSSSSGGSVADGVLTVSGTVSDGVLAIDGEISNGVLSISGSSGSGSVSSDTLSVSGSVSDGTITLTGSVDSNGVLTI